MLRSKDLVDCHSSVAFRIDLLLKTNASFRLTYSHSCLRPKPSSEVDPLPAHRTLLQMESSSFCMFLRTSHLDTINNSRTHTATSYLRTGKVNMRAGFFKTEIPAGVSFAAGALDERLGVESKVLELVIIATNAALIAACALHATCLG